MSSWPVPGAVAAPLFGGGAGAGVVLDWKSLVSASR
jgi:hypothetical protein